MPTIIDELIVTLGLDGTKFRAEADKTSASMTKIGRQAQKEGGELEDNLRKSQESTQKRLKQGEEVGRQTSQQFNKFRVEVAALFTTLAAGFGLQQFMRGVTETSAATGRLAANIGMSTKDLGIWQEAAKRTGGSAEGLGNSLLTLTQEHEKLALTGNSALLPYLRELRVQWSDATGAMRPMKDILFDLNAAVQGMDKRHANALLGGLGLDQGTINLLESSREELTKYLAEAERLGVATEADSKAGIAYQNSLHDLEQAFSTLGRTILTDVMPEITKFIKAITDWAAEPANKEFIRKEAVAALKEFGTDILAVIGFIKEWHEVAEALALYIGGRWLLAMTVGLGPVGVAIAAIAAGFLAIQQATKFFDPEQWSKNSIFWSGMSEEKQLQYHDSPASRKKRGEPERDPDSVDWMHPSTWFGSHGKSDVTADLSMTPTKQAFLRTLSGPESGGAYDIKNGGARFSGYEQFPSGVGAGGTSTASGRYQFTQSTWDDLSKKYGFKDFKPETQDKAGWALASDRYREQTGRDLEKDLDAGDQQSRITAALNPTWPSLPGGSQSRESQEAFNQGLIRNKADTPAVGLNVPAPTAQGYYDSMKKHLDELSKQKADDRVSSAGSSPGARVSSVETNINGPINIHTAATDSDGIAKNIGDSIKRYSYVSQSNTGLV